MSQKIIEHPTEEVLERFLLNRAEEDELELVETHILACESCVTRLETLDLQLSELKAALSAAEHDRIEKELNPAVSPWKRWFTIPTLSWAGAACAALALGLTIVPSSLEHRISGSAGSSVAEADLSACSSSDAGGTTLASCRGTETTTLPSGRPLDLHLDASDIPQTLVDVQVVNGGGAQVWDGRASVKRDRAEVKLPALAQSGPYFLRFYAPSAAAEHELLREYRFEVK